MGGSSRTPGFIARALLALIARYQRWLSPRLGANCRYLPTCSEYAQQAIAAHGARRGSWLAAKRIGRCHPFRDGGYDPVPRAHDSSTPSSGTLA